jgi:hypothetical protein
VPAVGARGLLPPKGGELEGWGSVLTGVYDYDVQQKSWILQGRVDWKLCWELGSCSTVLPPPGTKGSERISPICFREASAL